MKTKSVISLTTGLEDAEKVTVAFLVAVGSAEAAAAHPDVPDQGGGPPRGGRQRPGPGLRRAARRSRTSSGDTPQPGATISCARSASTPGTSTRATSSGNAELGGTVPMWEWIGDEPANTFSY